MGKAREQARRFHRHAVAHGRTGDVVNSDGIVTKKTQSIRLRAFVRAAAHMTAHSCVVCTKKADSRVGAKKIDKRSSERDEEASQLRRSSVEYTTIATP